MRRAKAHGQTSRTAHGAPLTVTAFRMPPLRLTPFLAVSLFWLCALAAAVAQGALLRSALRTALTGVTRGAPAQPAVPVASRRPMELLWMVLPALVLLGAFWWAWHGLQPSPFTLAAERAA